LARPGEETENPVTGERIVFRKTAGATEDQPLVFEYALRPGGSVPFAHVHPRQEERFEIISGRARIRVGKRLVRARAGEAVVVPAGTAHRLWNDSEEELRAIVEFRPALRTAEGFEQLFRLARDGKVGRRGPPNPFRLAILAREYRDEVYLAAVPSIVQRAVALLLAPVGRLLGYGLS
jgi:mannose-6-phosphate isomerase-like protein (cupin superfamily)